MVEPKVKSQLEVTLHSTLDLLGSIWLSLGFTTLPYSTSFYHGSTVDSKLHFTLVVLDSTSDCTLTLLQQFYQAIFNSTSIGSILGSTLYHCSTVLDSSLPWVHLTLLGSMPFTTMALHGFTMAVLESSSLSLLWSYFTLLHFTLALDFSWFHLHFSLYLYR